MHKTEYKNIYDNEAEHFYYVGTHQIIISLIKKEVGAKQKRQLKILDAGCGTGLLAAKLGQFGQIYGVDISTEALKYAKKRNIKVTKASVANLPFPNNTFDVVVSIDVLYHHLVQNDTLAIRELRRVLKKDGVLIIKLPAFEWLRTSHDDLVLTRKRYKTREVKMILDQFRFKNITITYAASFLLLPLLLKKCLELFKKPKAHSGIGRIWGPINNLLILLFKIENTLMNITPIPIGITLIATAKKN